MQASDQQAGGCGGGGGEASGEAGGGDGQHFSRQSSEGASPSATKRFKKVTFSFLLAQYWPDVMPLMITGA